MIELFYIGEDYYYKSHTEMSSIYHVGTFTRWDWGKVSIALEEGETVNIRPADARELLWAKLMLEEIEEHRKQFKTRIRQNNTTG